jgi:hypothetical protein
MRYSKATGQYSLWGYRPANGPGSPPTFDAAPLAEGALLRKDGQKLRFASLTYLDAGELLALVPSTGFVALYRRSSVPALIGVESWGDGADSAPSDGFAHRWEASSLLRGWQAAYVGAQTLMLLKPASNAYRMLNCSSIYSPGRSLPSGASAIGAAGGPPCALVVEGTLPERAPCDLDREHCLLAPQCGWCESQSQCVAANEDGVCFGNCPGGQLLYASGEMPFAGLVSQVR